jgi:hypothetical protein
MPAQAGIHVFAAIAARKTWMAGTSPAMTVGSGSARRVRYSAAASCSSDFTSAKACSGAIGSPNT